MDPKVIIICITVVIQGIVGNYIRAGMYGQNFPNTLAAEPAYANTQAYAPLPPEPRVETSTAFNGGFQVTSYSPIAPTGITVKSENLIIEGPLSVRGQMPFVGVVAVEGPLPASGQGSVTYGCGNGNVGIVQEGAENVAAGSPNGIYPGLAGLGLNPNGVAY